MSNLTTENVTKRGAATNICECDCELEVREKIPVHHTEMLGIEAVLYDAAERVRCQQCKSSTYSIPYLDGLMAAVAMLRIKEPVKLTGKDIKYLRKAAELSGIALAKILEVSTETLSRWENDKAPIGAAPEKLFRLRMAEFFRGGAPMIEYSPDEIFNMDVRACRSVDKRLVLHLELVKMREEKGDRSIRDVYSVSRSEAA